MEIKRKTWKNIVTKILPVTVICSLVFGSQGFAQTPIDDLKDNIDDKQAQLESINNEILNYQREINRRQNQIASLQNEIAIFDLQIAQTEKQIQAVELEIDKLNDEIAKIRQEIKIKEEEIEKQKNLLAETLRLINEYDRYTALEITVGNDTFSEFLDQMQYANNLQEKSQEILNSIKLLKQQLEAKEEELRISLAKQEELKKQLELTKSSLAHQRDGKQALLSQTRGQEKLYKNLLSQANQKQDQVESEIFDLEIALRRQLGDKSLPQITGALRWPASGILSQGYGKTGFTALGYNFHNGIDIAGPPGTKIYAAGDGIIYAMGTGTTAYGNWIVMKHTLTKDGKTYNIFTLYGHLQGFATSTGKGVRGGDLIGYMGNTGNTTRLLYGPERGYHLHFSVLDEQGFGIKEGAYQNVYGAYQIPYGYTYNPLNFLN